MYNTWISRNKIRKLKSKCKFMLFNFHNTSRIYQDWSIVNWSEESFKSHDHIEYDENKQTVTWIVPHDCHINGFVIDHEDKGILLEQHINTQGIDLLKGELIHVDVGSIYINLP